MDINEQMYSSVGYTMLRIAGNKELPWAGFSTAEMFEAKNNFLADDKTVV